MPSQISLLMAWQWIAPVVLNLRLIELYDFTQSLRPASVQHSGGSPPAI